MNSLRIHYLQHVSFEKPGYIETWAKSKNHNLTSTKLYQNEDYPSLLDFDWLIVLGGPMSINEEEKYPWLKSEKEFIKSAIKLNKTVIGICLGSQLIADVLGANVYPNIKKEIGWFPVKLSMYGKVHHSLKDFPDTANVFHWHGDTYDIPPYSIHLFNSEICVNQGFIYKKNVIGLQFHLEITPETLHGMLENCRHELIPDDYIQTEKEINYNIDLLKNTNKYLSLLLNNLEKNHVKQLVTC